MTFNATIWGSFNRTSPKGGRYLSITLVRNHRLHIRKRKKALPPKAMSESTKFIGGKRYLCMNRELWYAAYKRRFNRKTPDKR